MGSAPNVKQAAADLYLNLLKLNLTRVTFLDHHRILSDEDLLQQYTRDVVAWLRNSGLILMHEKPFSSELRQSGYDWPAEAETMVGLDRLENIQKCAKEILENGVPGDLVETGVWRGGSCIFMRAILAAYGDTTRKVWVADSFQGLPKPDPQTYPQDGQDTSWGHLWQAKELAIPMETVKANFERYGLLDDQVCFLPGWFRDTLPSAPINQIALLRLDGDLYESTIIALQSLYPKVSRGGYVLIDDYGGVAACKQAVDDFRAERSIRDPIQLVDWTGAFWKVG